MNIDLYFRIVKEFKDIIQRLAVFWVHLRYPRVHGR